MVEDGDRHGIEDLGRDRRLAPNLTPSELGTLIKYSEGLRMCVTFGLYERNSVLEKGHLNFIGGLSAGGVEEGFKELIETDTPEKGPEKLQTAIDSIRPCWNLWSASQRRRNCMHRVVLLRTF
jgi:hypothetical protein